MGVARFAEHGREIVHAGAQGRKVARTVESIVLSVCFSLDTSRRLGPANYAPGRLIIWSMKVRLTPGLRQRRWRTT